MEDNGSKLGGLGADSKVGENQGSSLPLNLNRDVVSEDLRKASRYEHGSKSDDIEQGSEVAIEVLYGVNNDNGKRVSFSAMEGVASDIMSSSSGEDDEEGETESDGEDEMESPPVNLGGVNDGKRAKEIRGSVTVIDRPSSSRDSKGLKFKMEPMESDSTKVKGEKLENEQNLGDAIGGDEVGDCSFEAVTAIPLAEVGFGFDLGVEDEGRHTRP
ncbi:hypothetical protein U1Q18_040302 [Sarracenia purpurea var. burkii]